MMIRPKILIVDDEIIIARELEARLTAMGYEVPAIASSGEEAIRLASEINPGLVLMDVVLKGEMDGIEAAAEIRRLLRIPIIYLTAYTDKQTLERARVTEPFGYVVKPFDERELNANIEMALYKHRVETQLRRCERGFVAAVDELTDALIGTEHGVITMFNVAAEAITLWSRCDAIGKQLSDVLQLVDRKSGNPIALETVADAPVISLAEDTLLIDKFGRRLSVTCLTTCIRDSQEQPVGTISVLRDPSGARHRAVLALNSDVALAVAQALTVRGMLQLCTDSLARNLDVSLARIWTVNATGEFLLLQASSGIFTSIEGEYSSVPMGKMRIGMVAQERKTYFTNNISDDLQLSDPEWASREGVVAFAAFPLLADDHLVGVMGVLKRRPLTETVLETLSSVAYGVAVGIDRKRLEEQLRHSQKMDAVGQLAAGIAHDFNNLLTVISGYSQLLLARSHIDLDSRVMIEHISGAGKRAATLTRQLLAFSRKQVMDPRVLDLNALVTETKQMLYRVIGEKITHVAVLDPKLASVMADPGQLEQVLLNLAVNACDAMPDGGQLTIETRNVELDETIARTYPMAGSGNYVLLAVSDTGIGMTQEVQAHIFEPFFTTKPPGKGTGLGLATVYGIVRQSGGHIGVYSEPGRGSTFKIYLPPAEGKNVHERSTSDIDSLPRGAETILLVEDEHSVRALSRFVLESCGYNVIEAIDGEEAIRICGDHKSEISLIVTDVVLPGIGGRALAERITAMRPGIQALYVSGYADDAVIRHGVLQAEVAFLQKPFTPAALAEKVRELLNDNP